MADRQKPKPATQKGRNDDRPNGKAAKKGRAVGARRTPLTELQKALMGKGAMKRVMRAPKAKADGTYE